MGVIDLHIEGHFVVLIKNSRKCHSMSLLYTDLGRPRGVTHPNVLLLHNDKTVDTCESQFCVAVVKPVAYASGL